MLRVSHGVAVAALATTTVLSGPAQAGGYVAPVIEIAYQAAKVNPTVPSQAAGIGLCGDSPEVCALIVLLLIGGVLVADGGGGGGQQVTNPEPVPPVPLPPNEPTGNTPPGPGPGPGPGPTPAPVPLGPTAPLLVGGLAALGLWRRKRSA